jgi:hypothetical protein
VRDKAPRDWCDWEASHVSIDPQHRAKSQYADRKYRMCLARLATHYWRTATPWPPVGVMAICRPVDEFARAIVTAANSYRGSDTIYVCGQDYLISSGTAAR